MEPDLERNVARRVGLYLAGSGAEEEGDRLPAAFINIGGAFANLGSSPLVLELDPGLNPDPTVPERGKRGVLFEMASRGVPIVHLLHIRGLALRWNLPWDPIPLPEVGSTRFSDSTDGNGPFFSVIAVLYFLLLAGSALIGRPRPAR
jgi:poly-gamma-glutamate system protein